MGSVHQLFHRRLLNGLGRFVHPVAGADDANSPVRGVSKPKIKDDDRPRALMCPMCMGYIKVGLQYARCKCGQPFHVVCLTRMGSCPLCGEPWDEEKVRTVTMVNGDQSALPSSHKLRCPSCDRLVAVYCNECECGAIFVRDNDSFLCPECGGRVDLDGLTCRSCGEVFRDCDIVTCPACGLRFDALAGPCECGTFMGDECPDCGCKLSLTDRSCPSCGVQMNFVE